VTATRSRSVVVIKKLVELCEKNAEYVTSIIAFNDSVFRPK
jgi:hypothetical protein